MRCLKHLYAHLFGGAGPLPHHFDKFFALSTCVEFLVMCLKMRCRPIRQSPCRVPPCTALRRIKRHATLSFNRFLNYCKDHFPLLVGSVVSSTHFQKYMYLRIFYVMFVIYSFLYTFISILLIYFILFVWLRFLLM